MPMSMLIRDAVFDPETTELLISAYEEAWQSVQNSGSGLAADCEQNQTKLMLARYIIEMCARGERDQIQLIAGALGYLAKANLALATSKN